MIYYIKQRDTVKTCAMTALNGVELLTCCVTIVKKHNNFVI